MCRRLFLGATSPLPLVDLAAGGGEFQVDSVDDDRGLRARLGVESLVEAATRDGCVCDLDVPSCSTLVETWPDDATHTRDLARAFAVARRLHGYVSEALGRGPVRAYTCWWDDERLPSLGESEIDADWFLRPELEASERRVLRVRRDVVAPAAGG